MSAKRNESYVAYRRRSAVRESDLAGLDEDESAAFSWDLIKRFGPYIAPYRGAASASAVLMVVSTLANLATCGGRLVHPCDRKVNTIARMN